MSDTWKKLAESDLDVQLDHWQPLSGGDFAMSFSARVVKIHPSSCCAEHLSDGSLVFIKTHTNPPPHHFSTEARGLQQLRQTNTVNVPAVLGVSDEVPYLALTWVEEARHRHHTAAVEANFGRQLAKLHKAECASFGRADNRSTGSLGLPNTPCSTWAEFYATQRLLPLASIATDKKALAPSLISAIETLANCLDDYAEPNSQAALLQGDLWAGNRLVDANGASWIIDPACHGGHREFDLAMMRLFGGYGEACFEAYQSEYALSDGWQERVALHQLAPLIVHAIKFGDSYIAPTRDALSQYVKVN